MFGSITDSSPIPVPEPANLPGDEWLLERMAARQTDALGQFYDRYSRVVFSLASRILSDRREAEEVTQDVFLAAWNRAADYRAARALPLTWLTAITRNKCIDRLRKSGRRLPSPPSQEEDDRVSVLDPDRAANPFLMAALHDLSRQIQDCLGRLPGQQRQAVELAYFEGSTHVEIAERLAEPTGTIKSRLRLALDKLRNCLNTKQWP